MGLIILLPEGLVWLYSMVLRKGRDYAEQQGPGWRLGAGRLRGS